MYLSDILNDCKESHVINNKPDSSIHFLIPWNKALTEQKGQIMNKYIKGFSFGLISGAMLGSVFALLYAPDKGSTTRDRLSYILSHYMEDLSRLIEQLRKEKDGIVSDAKIKGDQVVEEAQRKAEDLISEAEDLLNTIRATKQEAEKTLKEEEA